MRYKGVFGLCATVIALYVSFFPSAHAVDGLIAEGTRIADLSSAAPDGWHVAYITRGDLNKDGQPDAVIVLQEDFDGPAVGSGEETYHLYDPLVTVLVLALRDPVVGDYVVNAINEKLVPARSGFAMSPALEDENAVQISNGILSVRLTLFFSAGSWEAGNRLFKFRYQDGELSLIGYDHFAMHRASGALKEESVNFLTGQQAYREGNIADDDGAWHWTRLAKRPLIRFADMGDGWAFDPTAPM